MFLTQLGTRIFILIKKLLIIFQRSNKKYFKKYNLKIKKIWKCYLAGGFGTRLLNTPEQYLNLWLVFVVNQLSLILLNTMKNLV